MQINSVILIRKIRRAFNIELKNAKKTTILCLKVCFCSYIWRKLWTNSCEMPAKMRRFITTQNQRESWAHCKIIYEREKEKKKWKIILKMLCWGAKWSNFSSYLLYWFPHPASPASAGEGCTAFFQELCTWWLHHPFVRWHTRHFATPQATEQLKEHTGGTAVLSSRSTTPPNPSMQVPSWKV